MYQNKIGANRIQKGACTSTFSNDTEAHLAELKKEELVMRIMLRKSVADEICRQWGFPLVKAYNPRDPKFEYFKRKILAHIEKLERQEARQVQKSLAYFERLEKARHKTYEIGETATWGGKKYIKGADKKWRRYYEGHSKQAETTITRLKGQARKCANSSELWDLVANNWGRFMDTDKMPLPIVREFHQYVSTIEDEINAGVAVENRTAHRAKRKRTGTKRTPKPEEAKAKPESESKKRVDAFLKEYWANKERDEKLKIANEPYEAERLIDKKQFRERTAQMTKKVDAFLNEQHTAKEIADFDENTLLPLCQEVSAAASSFPIRGKSNSFGFHKIYYSDFNQQLDNLRDRMLRAESNAREKEEELAKKAEDEDDYKDGAKPFTEEIKNEVIEQMKNATTKIKKIEYSRENYNSLFPEGKIMTPLGVVKMGEHQFERLEAKDGNATRRDILGAVYQTLSEPDVIIKDRDSQGRASRLFIKALVDTRKRTGEPKTKCVVSIVPTVEGLRISVSNGLRKVKDIEKKIKYASIYYYKAEGGGAFTGTAEKTNVAQPSEIISQSKENTSEEKKLKEEFKKLTSQELFNKYMSLDTKIRNEYALKDPTYAKLSKDFDKIHKQLLQLLLYKPNTGYYRSKRAKVDYLDKTALEQMQKRFDELTLTEDFMGDEKIKPDFEIYKVAKKEINERVADFIKVWKQRKTSPSEPSDVIDLAKKVLKKRGWSSSDARIEEEAKTLLKHASSEKDFGINIHDEWGVLSSHIYDWVHKSFHPRLMVRKSVARAILRQEHR